MKIKNNLRQYRAILNYLPQAEGSCLISMGNTKVICAASVEMSAPPHAEAKGTGWVTAEYAMLPRSGPKRGNRKNLVDGGRSREISRLIGRSLRAITNLESLKGYNIVLDCDVIQADGGTRTASINGAYLALAQAFRKLLKKGLISEWPLTRVLAAVSVGWIKNRVVVDMNYQQDLLAEADLNFVMTEKNEIVEIQVTAEKKVISAIMYGQLIKNAKIACQQIIKNQKKQLNNKFINYEYKK